MTTICTYLCWKNPDHAAAIEHIILAFPCFVGSAPVQSEDEDSEISIECRREDAAAIERILAPYV